MFLADVSIKRPVFATMMILALVVIGVFAFQSLGLDLFPKVDFPTVTITTTLRGTSPEEMETQVTKPIEEAVNTISGIDELRSQTFEGVSQVIVSFVLEKPVDTAAQEVRDRVSRVLARLPQGTDPPVIEKIDPDAAPVMSISVSGPLPLRDLTYLARKRIKEPLESVNGVGAINVVGGREREIHVWLDPDKLTAYGLSVSRVRDALRNQNVEVPGGRVDQGNRELILRTVGRVEAVEGFRSLVVATIKGVPVRITDIATVEDSEQEARSLSRLDGKNSVSLIVQKQSGTNTVDVVKLVRQRLDAVTRQLPDGTKAEIIRDQSRFIEASVHTVEEHLIFGAILASLVVFLFIRDWRSTLIVSLAIPTSIISTFAVMKYLGFTLNNMTLLGLTVSVGIVIDDAIVVLENIFRHIEEKGESPMRAASTATQEIGLAVMATTLSLVIIFLPVAFMTGIVGRFLNSYGLTVAFAVMVSLFVSFTLTPMLSSRFLKIAGHGDVRTNGAHGSKESRFYRVLDRGYTRLLTAALRRRWAVIVASVACIVAIPVVMRFVGFDFFPPDDQDEFQITIKAPEGFSLAQTNHVVQQIETDIRTLPGVTRLLTSIGEGQGAGVNDALIYVGLTPLRHRNWKTLFLTSIGERDISQFTIMADARTLLMRYPELRTSVQII
ncbi:MAG: efflux RND transporter permease subunit, partial [Candidatus Latescibacteria bacterium]|nr:efflux RND transporter permease subunit [Candidatus Latescibacterota bacterium]